jgi:hypothetical protein
MSCELTALSVHCKLVKDREDETSQLNRLGVAYFHLCLLPISATCLTSAFRRRTVISLASQLSRFEQHPNNITVPVQVLTENWQLRTDNCFCTE